MKFGVEDVCITSMSSCVSVKSVQNRAYIAWEYKWNCAHIFIFCLIVLQFGIEDLILKLLDNFEFQKNQYSQSTSCKGVNEMLPYFLR